MRSIAAGLVSVAMLVAVSAVRSQDPAPTAAATPAVLPPVECVRGMREARLAWQAGDRQKAMADLDRAVEACPDHVDPLLERLELHRKLGDAAGVEADLALLRARLADPARVPPEAAFARAVSDPGANVDELELIRARLTADLAAAETPRRLRQLVVVEARLGRNEDARATLTRLLAVDPSPEVRWAAVRLDVALERWGDAIPELEALGGRSGTSSFSARLHLIHAYGAVGRTEDAMRTALALYGASGDLGSRFIREMVMQALLDAGWALHDRGDVEHAATVFRKVLEIDPDNTEARAVLELVYASPEARAAATAARDRALEREENPGIVLEEGARRLAVGDAAGAWDLLDRAARGLGDNELAWYDLGLAAVKLERWEAAAEAFGHAVRLDPTNPTSRLNLGTALARIGRCAEAVEVLEALLVDRPEAYQAHYWLGRCWAELGDAAKAAEAMERYQLARPRQ